MTTTTYGLLWLLRIGGLTQLALGLLFWLDRALTLIPLHILLGLVLVLTLWALAGIAAVARVGAGPVMLAIVWGVGVVVLGMTQTQLLPGPLHWLVQVAHLLIGLAALGIGTRLAERILERRGRPLPA